MESKIKTAKKELIFKHYVVRKDDYHKNFFDNKEKAIEELKKNIQKNPLGINYIRVEYTYWEKIYIEEEPY